MVGVVEQERFANPAKVSLGLLFEVDPRPDSGVDEKIVAEAAAIGEALQEVDVIARDCTLNHLQGVIYADPLKLVRLDPVALEALRAAEPAPFGDELGITAQDTQQDFLMIAEKKDRLDARAPVGAQPFKNLRGARAPVYKITDEDQHGFGGRPLIQLCVDPGQQLFQQIETPVDIANDISAVTRRSGRLLPGFPREVEHQVLACADTSCVSAST